MKPTEMRQKSREDLEALLAERRGRLYVLRSLVSEKKVKNVHEMSLLRKDVARVLTILREK